MTMKQLQLYIFFLVILEIITEHYLVPQLFKLVHLVQNLRGIHF